MCRGRLFNLLSAVTCLFGSFPPVCWWVVFGVVLCLVYCFGGVLGFVLCGFWWCLGAVLPLVCLSGSWSVRCFLCCSCGGFACVVVCMVFLGCEVEVGGSDLTAAIFLMCVILGGEGCLSSSSFVVTGDFA